MRAVLLTAMLLCSTAPGMAAAITYEGTIGKLPVVVELTKPADGPVVGRYSYLSKGGDIPLDATSGGGNAIVLDEEGPCTQGTCVSDDTGVVAKPPISATWTLTPSADGQSLTGKWLGVGKTAGLDVVLKKLGQRDLPEGTELSPMALRDSVANMTFGDDVVFSAETAPYDFAKMNVALKEGPVETMDGSTYRYVTDPRTQFAFPRVVSLSDGSDIGPINRLLADDHAAMNFAALDCEAALYAGFGGNDQMIDNGPGSLGGYPDETVKMQYLSPTVMNYEASGSTYCGGAHPDNHDYTMIYDTKTGDRFPLGHVLKGWIATTSLETYEDVTDQDAALAEPGKYMWGADQDLIDYAIAHRVPSEDKTMDEECGINDLIASNLSFRFLAGDRLVFTLEGLPNAVTACGGEFYTVKLADVPELLRPEAVKYFPSLAKK